MLRRFMRTPASQHDLKRHKHQARIAYAVHALLICPANALLLSSSSPAPPQALQPPLLSISWPAAMTALLLLLLPCTAE
jgi:hypothetical protein